jgi:hypothetical protein
MGTKSREVIYGSAIRYSAERAKESRKVADRLAVKAWNDRMLGYQGPAQPSPTIGDALNAGCGYLEVRCLGCGTHQTVALDIVRRPKTTPIHELERRCGLSATRCFWRAVVRGTPSVLHSDILTHLCWERCDVRRVFKQEGRSARPPERLADP